MPRNFLILVPRRRSDPDTNKKLLSLLAEYGELTRTGDWVSLFNYASIHQYDAIFMPCTTYADEHQLWQRDLKRLHPHQVMILYGYGPDFKRNMVRDNRRLFGCFDTHDEPGALQRLMARLDRYLQLKQSLKGKVSRKLLRASGFGDFVGNSEPMLDTYRQMTRVAGSDYTVLIRGESGSGKELVARTIHQLSPRADKPFVSINCAAIPENLLESELFGYEKGAFTGANQKKAGKFELAHGGTLFLDEIGDMPLGLQVKLLRVLEDRKIQPLGSLKETPIDIRLVTATHRDLEGQISTGEFREDLHYRLNVIPLLVPPLRDRSSDMFLLTLFFLEKLLRGEDQPIERISWSLIEALQGMNLKGNVRELENILTRCVLATEGTNLNDSALPTRQEGPAAINSATSSPEPVPLDPLWKVERDHLQRALQQLDGNISQISQTLEISRTAIYRKIRKYELDSTLGLDQNDDGAGNA